MKNITILNPEDVAKIIAKHFAVDETKVHVKTYMETKGYGMGEHDEPTFEIEVETGGKA